MGLDTSASRGAGRRLTEADERRASPADVVEVGRFFRLCADRGLALEGDC